MNNEIKEYLDSANFKFKEVDEEGNEVELTLSEEMETLINNNKMLANIVTNLQEENENLKERVQIGQNAFLSLNSKIDKAIEYINKHCVNDRLSEKVGYKCYTMADTNELEKIIKILKGEDNEQ